MKLLSVREMQKQQGSRIHPITFVSPSEPVTPGSLLFRGDSGAFKVIPIYSISHGYFSIRGILL